MNKIAIKAENISKQYRLGQVGTGTLSHDLNRLFAKIRGKEDPYLRIGEANDRASKGNSEYVWSLQDINFEINKGDAVGIIGKNGAGKSTLLKLLSKVTQPTTGSFKIDGRIASLLEVGTGFHPEMTGRENIYLNGAILGMTRKEITRKFDEIVDFSGVERYIDTPVKRYSSGMYVRLAFAVAAHLESEILIVDEVLAVGDAEFQKKCLGKMSDVSKGSGRTVLFVSHNMAAVKNLCNKGIVLEKGRVKIESDNIDECVNLYISEGETDNSFLKQFDEQSSLYGNHQIRLNEVEIISSSNKNFITIKDAIKVKIRFTSFEEFESFNLSLTLRSYIDEAVILSQITEQKKVDKGQYEGVFEIPSNFLNNKPYSFDLFFVNQYVALFKIANIINFEVKDNREDISWYGNWGGYVRPNLPFNFEKI